MLENKISGEFDDEQSIMDEIEKETDQNIHEAVTLNDPLSVLDLNPPVIVPEGTTIFDAVKRIQNRAVGCVLIVKNSALAGILTERDILLKITGRGLDFHKAIVDNFMTPNPEYLKMIDPIAYAFNKMTVGGFRHIPIVEEGKKPIGLVSLVDIVRHISNYFSDEIINLPPKPQRKSLPSREGG
ncbi:MAG: CBS domain-containing protein [Candidatus Neomarinimicrobiota bacterium]